MDFFRHENTVYLKYIKNEFFCPLVDIALLSSIEQLSRLDQLFFSLFSK